MVRESDAIVRLNIPSTDQRELAEIEKVLQSGYLTQGPKTVEFESKVADYIGCEYAFAMSSCTTALHLALVVLDIGSGDEVLVSDFTFPASANVVVQQGATPVLVDIDLDSFTMNALDLEKKITSKSKAIIAVDAFGCSADYDPIIEIANKHGLPIVEDAATAIGATYYDRFCGNITTIGCFSFHPRKVITTGEGGMITTNRADLAERIRVLRNHGGTRAGAWYSYDNAGFNYRLSDVLSAIGVVQMEKLPDIVARKRDLAVRLGQKLSKIENVRTPSEPKWGGHIYQSYVVLLDEDVDQKKIVNEMNSLGIETTLGTYALHDQPFFQKNYRYKSGDLPSSHAAFSRSLTLPMYPSMEYSDLDVVAETLEAVIGKVIHGQR